MQRIGFLDYQLLSAAPTGFILLSDQHLYGKFPLFRHAELQQREERGRICASGDIRPLLSADFSKTSMVCPYTNGYWKRNGKESWKTYSTPKCESLKFVTDTDSTPCRISPTFVKTLSEIPHALYARKQPAVRKSGKYNKQPHPTNVPISCTMRTYWLAY